MSKYSNYLPQLYNSLFMTDGGLETTLIHHENVALPRFAVFDLPEDAAGTEILPRYSARCVDITPAHGLGIVLEAPTRRASPDRAAKLGYDVAHTGFGRASGRRPSQAPFQADVSHVNAGGPASAGRVASPSSPALRITLPALYCPFSAAIHADAHSIEEGTIAWMKRYGYIKTTGEEEAARSARFGIHAARVYPRGRTEAIQIASDLTTRLFLIDDIYFEEPGLAGALSVTVDHVIRSVRTLRYPENLPPTPTASLLALQDISRRMRALATHEQVDRIINGLVEYFMAGCCEAVSFSCKTLPTAADYISVRESLNCLRSVCFVFIEIVGGYELPGPTWCRPDLQAVVGMAVRVISYHHDILSGLRELSGEVPMNLPAVLARQQGLSMAEAFVRVGELADAATHSFVDLTDRLLATEPGPAVEKYVDGLKSWVRGNLDWSLTTGRYRVCDYL